MKEQSKHSNKLFCFGYGYTCDYIGYELTKSDDWIICGTTRDNQKKRVLEKRGIETHIFDGLSPLGNHSKILENVTHILISTPPNDDGDPVFLSHADDIKKLPNLKWLGYLSTTGVYGNKDGAWVDETTSTNPSGQRGIRRVKAEKQWLSLFEKENLPVHIFRLAGIYGPGRSAFDSIRAGVARRIDKPGHLFNRIHVEDIAQICIRSALKPSPGSIYNVADNAPASSQEIISYACKLVNANEPALIPFNQADLTPMAQSFYADNKRVKNDKIKKDLEIQLRYPSYKEGLKACLNAEKHMLQIFNSIEQSA